MWAAVGRVTQANYNSSNELVLGTLSLCDFRVKILTDVAPSPLTSPPPRSTPLHVFTVCWNFLVYLGFLFSSFRSVSPRIVCLPVYLLAYLLILHHSQSHVSATWAERERDRERGGERGKEQELLLVSSHCVKFLASTSFGILCQGHSTNSLDLTNIENICVFAR